MSLLVSFPWLVLRAQDLIDKLYHYFLNFRIFKMKSENKENEVLAGNSPTRSNAVGQRYPCTVCGIKFRFQNHLQRHLPSHSKTESQYSHETYSGTELYECKICNKQYKQKGGLKKHSYIHSDETFTCDVCGKTFVNPSNLKGHMKVHTKTGHMTVIFVRRALVDLFT